ncbi:MAG: anthranilate phosphoribosyltransferase [Lentisphaeria bacterium]|nr:anthranilate phosphoribosyltransferase [Lentisphaeria bacterium]
MSLIKESLKKIVDRIDLTKEETKAVFQDIMSGNCTEAQIAAWVTALRMKGETSEEVAACVEIMREAVFSIECKDKFAVDSVGTGGDGAHTINISTTAAFVTAGAGITVAKHGNRAVSSKSGSADVLAALGINLDLTPEIMEDCLNNLGFTFLFAPKLHPAMKYAVGPRKAIGIRTIFNILGPMTNPAGVTRGVIGVFSEHYCKLLADAALSAGVDHMLFVHGEDGLDEVTICGKTTVYEVQNGEVKTYKFDPRDHGFEFQPPEAISGGSPEENAKAVLAVLNGNKGPHRDVIVLNAAAAILASDKVSSWSEAIEKAIESIDSGSALEKLNRFIEASHSK